MSGSSLTVFDGVFSKIEAELAVRLEAAASSFGLGRVTRGPWSMSAAPCHAWVYIPPDEDIAPDDAHPSSPMRWELPVRVDVQKEYPNETAANEDITALAERVADWCLSQKGLGGKARRVRVAGFRLAGGQTQTGFARMASIRLTYEVIVQE